MPKRLYLRGETIVANYSGIPLLGPNLEHMNRNRMTDIADRGPQKRPSKTKPLSHHRRNLIPKGDL